MKKCISKTLLLIVGLTIGILSGCSEQVDSNKNPQAQSQNLSESDLSYDVSGLSIYKIESIGDYRQIIGMSEIYNKPVLFEFVGWDKEVSKEYEDRVWTSEEIYPLLKNQFMIAQISVDCRFPLADSVNFPNSLSTDREFWLKYEKALYYDEAQLLFDIVNHKNESLVSEKADYGSHSEDYQFMPWLEKGLRNFKKETPVEKELDILTSNETNDISEFQEYIIQTEIDFGRILSLSKKLNKPVLVYLTGLNSVGYRSTEIKLWPDSLVYPILKNDFLIATIYVDDRTVFSGANIDNPPKTYGEYWMNYEVSRYNKNTQPVFEIVNYKNESMTTEFATYGSHGNPKLYSEWLKEGLINFRNK